MSIMEDSGRSWPIRWIAAGALAFAILAAIIRSGATGDNATGDDARSLADRSGSNSEDAALADRGEESREVIERREGSDSKGSAAESSNSNDPDGQSAASGDSVGTDTSGGAPGSSQAAEVDPLAGDAARRAELGLAARTPLDRAKALEAGGWVEGARTEYIAIAAAAPTSPEGRASAVSAARLALAADDAKSALAALATYSATVASGVPDRSGQGQSTDQGQGVGQDQDVGQNQSTAPAQWPPEVDYHLGSAAAALGQAETAAAAYSRYAVAVPVLADQAHRAAGDALLEAGLAAAAAEAYALALAASAPRSSAVLSAIKLGNARLQLDEFDLAILAYADAEQRAEIDDERAQALAGMVATHLEAGRAAEATAVRRRIVSELPGTATARISLERLREAGIQVAPEEAAAVLSSAGEHAAALVSIQTAIAAREAASGSAPPDWHLLALRSERAVDNFDAVYARADALIASGAAGARAAEVALLRARALEAESRGAEAAAAYLALADAYPASSEAAEALWRRSLLVESLDGVLAGADAHALFAARFPGDARAPDAAFRAGWLRWRSGRLDAAAQAWIAIVGDTKTPPAQRARAEYWLGRIAAEQEGPVAAEVRWRSAIAQDPESFHALLAAERLGMSAVAAPPAGPADSVTAIGTWLASWSPGVDQLRFDETLAAVPADPLVARGAALLRLGEGRAARRALKAALGEMGDDAVRLAALALFADSIDLPDISIPAAATALRLSPSSVRPTAPAALHRLIYPLGSAELVRAESRAHGLPPALMFALVWQESRFDPGAISSAGARGLTQVMPATGADIAGRLGEGGYELEQLYRPHVSTRFGAWYLSEQLKNLADDQRVALAAYNGGPGNARRWLDASDGDMDVFVESIHLSETRRYLPAVITARAWYERLDPADAQP